MNITNAEYPCKDIRTPNRTVQSKIMNKPEEEGIEVLVRIRPILPDEEDQRRSVLLSDSEDNTIVVETHNKKEFFSFDFIASEHYHQQQLFERLGEPILEDSLKGYNCCVFSYGQTGAGKTYSILGHPSELIEDPFSDSRGILPRLLEEMFNRINNPCNGFQSVTVTCSYLQIYNQQIIDLMTKESRNLSIREDLRRGVFVEGLTQLSITNYQQVLGIISKGLAVRKTAATFMNAQSSRSHTIFTMLLTMEFQQEGVKKSLKSKVHVVDLAGSQRIKLTKVDGERLKQGCNINKSLLTLSNVICSLVESGKKKKYIPFRDSKLTFFLKDSLSGNSKTKLLANISPKTAYLGDTISTLMFAKRAKIIRTKVEPNENIADNFESLRTEIRKLREELAQTKFIKTLPAQVTAMSPMSPKNRRQQPHFFEVKQVLLPLESCLKVDHQDDSQFEQALRVFQENELSYRAIIENCLVKCKQNPRQAGLSGNLKSIFEEKKRLEATVGHQQKLLSNFPPFTKIFEENMQLKNNLRQIQSELDEILLNNKEKCVEIQTLQNTIILLKAQIENMNQEDMQSNDRLSHSRRFMNSPMNKRYQKSQQRSSSIGSHKKRVVPELNFESVRGRNCSMVLPHWNGFRSMVERQNSIIDEYETVIQQLQSNFRESLATLKESYKSLQQLYHQEQKQKHQIRKHKRKEPELQALSNQNEYLKLNIMELENQISRLEEEVFKKGVQAKAIGEEKDFLEIKLEKMEKLSADDGIKQSQIEGLIEKLRMIKQEAQRADGEVNEELAKDCSEINQLRNKLSKMMKQNYTLVSKNEALLQQNNVFKVKISELTSIDQSIIQFKQGMECTTTLDPDEDFTFEKTLHEDIVKDLERLTLEKERLSRQVQECEIHKIEQQTILQKASAKILSLTKDVAFYKEESVHYAEEARVAEHELQIFVKESEKSHQKIKLLQVDVSRLKKEIEKNENVSAYIKSQFQMEPMQFIEEARSLKQRNSLLNEENKRLQESLMEVQKKSNLLKISKSLTSLTNQKFVGGLTPKIIHEKHQKQVLSVPMSQRDGDHTFKKKQSKKVAGMHQERQKPALQFKAKPQTAETNRFMKRGK